MHFSSVRIQSFDAWSDNGQEDARKTIQLVISEKCTKVVSHRLSR